MASAGEVERRRLHRKRLVNGIGAAATAVVFVIVLVTKFSHGAWIVVVAAPVLFLAMKAVSRHYARIGEQLAPSAAGVTLPSRVHAVVLVSNLLAPTLRALAFAEAMSPATLRAVKVAAEEADDPLPREWQERGVPVPLVVIESPYRETVRPVLRYVRQLRREYPGDVISIVIPEYVVAHWWEHLLHNQTALRLKGRLLFEPSVAVTSVPWVLGAQEDEPRWHERSGHLHPQRGHARRVASRAPGPRLRPHPAPPALRPGARRSCCCRC